MTRIINSLKEIEMGDNYIKEEKKELKIECKRELLRVYDLSSKVVYTKTFDENNTALVLKNILKEAGETAVELIEYLAFKSDFKIREIYKNEVFNPFFKELEGELKIKSKTGYFTKTQVEKILKHKDTKIIRNNVYTDDYAYDAENNYKTGVEVSRLDMLDEVRQFFHGTCGFENGKFTVFTVGLTHSTEIINPNIVII